MPYVVAGTLTLPESSKPATNVTITFRNLMTVSPLIVASESSVTTSAIGAYSISLQYSVYAVEVTYYNNRPISAGQIVLNSETQTGLDLPTLLNGGEYEPATPAWILQIEAWLVEAQNSANASANSAQTSQSHANASSASAAASAASAAQASQISGLSTVAEAIGMAALPLPDVWAPLSDSLRLITGYGRDVLVGSDVVARMVNFSRNSTATYISKDGQLKTAAANEPRFEKEGLLIEGQSTNLFNKAAGTNFSWISSVLSQSAGSAQLPFDVFQKAITSSNAAQGASERVLADIYGISNPAAQAGGPVTVSALMFGDADAIVSASPELKILVDLSITGISRSVIKINSTTVRVIWSGVIAPGSSATFVAFQLNWLNRLPSVVAGCYQVEALPFASSYIPTNGAAVTRATDVCWIPVENGGLPGMDNEKTMSLTSNILGVNGPFNFILATPWGAIDYTLTHERVSGNTPELAMNTPVALKTSVRKVARFTKGGGCAAIFGDIQKTGPTADWSLSTSRIVIGSMNESGANPHFGHVKDLKIWLKPLSDAQMKAIA